MQKNAKWAIDFGEATVTCTSLSGLILVDHMYHQMTRDEELTIVVCDEFNTFLAVFCEHNNTWRTAYKALQTR